MTAHKRDGIMSSILTRITQNSDLRKQNRISCINAVIMMGIFTFLFLGAEYLYDNMISLIVSEEKTVFAQNCALGASAVGFLSHLFFSRLIKKRGRVVSAFFAAIASVLCIFLICQHISYRVTFISGLVLFLLLGLLGGVVYYASVCLLPSDKYLARIVGIAYMLGVLLQFANNNLVNMEIAEAVILSVFLLILVFLLVKTGQGYSEDNEQNENESVRADTQKGRESAGQNTKRVVAGILLIVLVVLMTCVFSTLDNAVTLVHATGAVDIGQWPRILLALSGLAAAYASQRKNIMEEPSISAASNLEKKDKLQEFSKSFSLTPRETEVFDRLVNTEDSIQAIAESLYISRRTLERYISAIYGKTGVKSRIGLIRI